MIKKTTILVVAIILFTATLTANQEKSTGKAVLLSALFPGTGEVYLGRYNRGGLFMGTELLIILSYLRLNNEVDWKRNSYQLHAKNYADVPLGSSDNYYRFISNYVSSDDYNDEIEMYIRNRYIVYDYNPEQYHLYRNEYLITGDEQWEWNSRDSWLEYRSLRRDKQRLEILANFALGASVVNRIVSVLDTLLISRSISNDDSESSSAGKNPPGNSFLSGLDVELDFRKIGIQLNYEYNF